jgi:steroid 5-alpha reductase family enzyme
MENLLHDIFNGNSQIISLAGNLATVMLVTALICFVVSEIVRNYSQVDKLWSIMPVIYSIIVLYNFPDSPRIWIMTILVAAWGLRLSLNFARKGGYSKIPWRGEEDYRWEIMRRKPMLRGRIRFGIFNLLFISLYQNILILLFSTPLLVAAQYAETPLSAADIIAAILIIGALIIETTADNQLFSFQQQKKGEAPHQERFERSLKNGFISDGLFSKSRHPNFAAEQAVWVFFYIFGASASGEWLNWSASGAILLILLFIGSSTLTERISSSKYPEYKEYQKRVPRFLPRLF